MTEIPEHLLKRSRDRRAALGLGGGDTGGDASSGDQPAAAATPATTEAAAPAAPAGPAPRKAAAAAAPAPPPKPDPPYVAAARSRAKIPFWAMGALSLLPVWVFMYVRSLTAEPEEASGPLGVGAEIYTSAGCSGCHGNAGEGGVGYRFSEGEVLATFPHIEDQLRFVYFGTNEYNIEGVEIPGNPDRPDGPHITGTQGVMPQQGADAGGALTDDEILGVVCHERYTLGGADPDAEEYVEEFETWCAEESPAYAALEDGTTLTELAEAGLVTADGSEIEIIPIGDVPVAGSPPG